jgi:heme-degrading monooxygenase HmoA
LRSSDGTVFAIVWEYHVRPGREAEFERAYGPAGDWARLFARGNGYLGTELFHDDRVPGRYLTIDRWTTQEAYGRFYRLRREEYEALDFRCEQLTEGEHRLGAFSVLAPPEPPPPTTA